MNPGLKIFMVFLLTVSMAGCAGHNKELSSASLRNWNDGTME